MNHLSFRSLIVAAIGSAVVSMSSMYIALRMGALPWPTVFAALFSMFILKFFKASLHEINVAHTGVSAGGLVAGGLAFTIPSAWIAGVNLPSSVIFLSALVGAIFGVGMTMSTRKAYVEDQKLPFPMGIAAAETLKAGDEGGRKAKILFSWMGISAVFTYLRDGLGLVPVVVAGFGMFPMAIGIGFIIGTLFTMSWFAGGIVSFIFSKFGVGVSQFGLGMIVGGGLGMMIFGLLKSKSLKFAAGKLDLITAALIFVLSMIFQIGVLPSILLVFLGYIAVHMAASVDGSTGIDPMEVFSIIVLMIMRAVLEILPVSTFASQTGVFIAAVVAVATGIAGDSLQDMKTGYILKTNPKAQLISEAVGAFVGVIVASAVIISLYSKFGTEAFGPGKTFPVPQAAAVSRFINSSSISGEFLWGLIVALILQLLKIPALTFGIGLYLPLFITLPVALGGILRLLFEIFFKERTEDASIAASGILGGEGLTGVLIGLFLPGSF